MEKTSIGVGGEDQQLIFGFGSGGVNSTDFRGLGNKRSLEWDPHLWNWDGDLFIATPIHTNSTPSNTQFFPLQNPVSVAAASNSSSSCSDELSLAIQKETTKRDLLLDRKRRVIGGQDDTLEDEAAVAAVANLALKLGGHDGHSATARPPTNWQETTGKKPRTGGTTSNRAVCQVEDCGADLSKAKDYHRRHKVCEMHSKASRALVANVMQRFCQQCSRFHALQEFDEGKRSCRRRLAGHNKRRRKTQPDTAANNNSLNDNQASGYLLISLLKILSNMHTNRASGTNDEDLLSHLLRSLANQGALSGDKNICGLLQESPKLMRNGPSLGKSKTGSTLPANDHQVPPRPKQQNSSILAVGVTHRLSHSHNTIAEDLHTTSSHRLGTIVPSPGSSVAYGEGLDGSASRSKLNSFDLNDVYIDSDEGIEDVEQLPVSADLGTGSVGCPLWMQQDSHLSSPPQTSGNSDSASAQSASSSSGEAQSRTDRIVFKLFGREPSDFPFVLRAQILDWLAHSPTDIESYIRPGCIILTLYLRLPDSKWEELSCDLGSSLSKLLDVSDGDSFWRIGWFCTRVQNRIAFAYNGQMVVDTSLSFQRNECSTILSVKPIAVPVSETAQFLVKGINLTRPSTSLLCALEGKYLVLESNCEFDEHGDAINEHGKLQCLTFSCSFPEVSGRGFVEVEDHGLSSSFFPFIVAEKDICSEISMLESDIELTEIDYIHGDAGKTEARDRALDFIHEMGWLLHWNNLNSRLSHLDPNSYCFSFTRFKWLMEFSIDHDWCAVVKKLLDILLDGRIGGGDSPFLKYALLELGLLHRAVRKNSRSLVELLLKYTPQKVAWKLHLEYKSLVDSDGTFLFRPDFGGPGGLTPLHVAAGRDGSEDVLDALTDDPGEVAVKAWKNARDSTGSTPEDYARLRGHYSYIHLIQKKINLKAPSGNVVVDIPSTGSKGSINQKQDEVATTTFEIAGTQIIAIKHPCRLCERRVAYGNGSQSLLYRPAMLSMVAIAAVCVCVALLFKSSPEVLYIFRPFRWEMLEYGSN